MEGAPHLGAGDLRQCGAYQPLPETAGPVVLASEALQHLFQRVADLEAENVSLRRQKLQLQQHNEELVASQARVPELEARLARATERADHVEKAVHVEKVESKRHQEITTPTCMHCVELEKQQAEIASDFGELRELCKVLFSNMSSGAGDFPTLALAAKAPLRGGGGDSTTLSESQRLRLGCHFDLFSVSARSVDTVSSTLLGRVPATHLCGHTLGRVPATQRRCVARPSSAPTRRPQASRRQNSLRLGDSLRARYEESPKRCHVCTQPLACAPPPRSSLRQSLSSLRQTQAEEATTLRAGGRNDAFPTRMVGAADPMQAAMLAKAGKPPSQAAAAEATQRGVGGNAIMPSAYQMRVAEPIETVIQPSPQYDSQATRSNCLTAFDLIDRNGDGVLSRAEVIKAARDNADVRQLLQLPEHIRQEDGSRNDFEHVFQAIDKDESKSITRDEFEAYISAARRVPATDLRTPPVPLARNSAPARAGTPTRAG